MIKLADKRMFSKQIIESDAFTDMPLSTQALYFHLGMHADDDGFLNNAKKIMRSISANQNDYDLLIAKSFIIQFPNGICVIKHWHVNNYIRPDRYKETVYVEEKAMLQMKKNKSYTLNKEKNTNTSVNQIEKVNEFKQLSNNFDAEKAWNNTFDKYPNKSGYANARNIWCKKVLEAIDQRETITLIYNAMRMYIKDYKKRKPDDVNYNYMPKMEKWLNEECDYWVRQYEENKRLKAGGDDDE